MNQSYLPTELYKTDKNLSVYTGNTFLNNTGPDLTNDIKMKVNDQGPRSKILSEGGAQASARFFFLGGGAEAC